MSDNKNLPKESTNLPIVEEDIVKTAIENATLEVRRQRIRSIGSLLDTASEVLRQSLEDNRPAAAKLRSIELAIDLYNSQEDQVRKDKELQLRQQQLELEHQKLLAPGGPLFQQNNLYNTYRIMNPTAVEQEMLLDRKRAQDAVLSAYLSKPETVIETDISDAGDEENAGEDE